MEVVRSPYIKVLYNGKNISEEISKYLASIVYTDKVDGESDTVEITVDDVDGLWRGQWYPEKGATLDVTIGYPDRQLSCGQFQIDDIQLEGPPDTVKICGLAAGIKEALRTPRSYAHENKTLRQIALTAAQRNGLTVTGEIPDVTFRRITQNRETDLNFLRRISTEYGCLFSIRGKQLVFTTIYDIEDRQAVTELDRLDIERYSFRDKVTGTYKDAKVTYHNPEEKKVVVTEYKTQQEKNPDDFAYSQVASSDTKVIYTKAENKQQAEKKAKASLHRANSKQQEGTISLEGNPLLVAGNNFTLTGMGKLSGKWHVSESKHAIDRSGYKTELQLKRVGNAKESQQGSTKRGKAALAAQRTPQSVSVQNIKVQQEANPDNFTFTQIAPNS